MSVCVYSVYRYRPCDGPTVYRIKKLKKRPRSKGLQIHREREREKILSLPAGNFVIFF
jgi:hypothetical protein